MKIHLTLDALVWRCQTDPSPKHSPAFTDHAITIDEMVVNVKEDKIVRAHENLHERASLIS